MALKRILLPISSLFLAIGFLAIGYGMILTFVGVYLKDIGISNTVIGIINAAFFLGAMSSSVLSQKIISTVGHIRSFAAFASFFTFFLFEYAVFISIGIFVGAYNIFTLSTLRCKG